MEWNNDPEIIINSTTLDIENNMLRLSQLPNLVVNEAGLLINNIRLNSAKGFKVDMIGKDISIATIQLYVGNIDIDENVENFYEKDFIEK